MYVTNKILFDYYYQQYYTAKGENKTTVVVGIPRPPILGVKSKLCSLQT